MKIRIGYCSIVVLVGLMSATLAHTKAVPLAIVSPAIQSQATNPPYLSQMPSVERVKAEIKGTDPLDTAARQIGALLQLREIISDLARAHGIFSYRSYTPDETRLYDGYYAAYYSTWQAIDKSLSRPERSKLSQSYEQYRVDPKFRDELLRKFFSAEFRAAYYKATSKQPSQPQNEQPSAPSSTKPKETQPGNRQPGASVGNSTEAYLAQGDKYREAKDYAKAIAPYKKAIALDPKISVAHYYLGFCFYGLDQFQNALPALQEAVRLKPNSPGYNFLLGSTYYKLQKYQPALTSLQQAIRLKTDEPSFHLSIGNVYADGFKQYERAIPEYREAIRLKPDYDVAHNQLGEAFFRLEEYPDAAAAFQQAIRLDPNFARYRQNLGLTYVEMGKKEEALQVHQALQKIDLAKAKELEKEIEITFDVVDDPKELIGLGYMLGGDPDTRGVALRIFRRVILLNRDAVSVAKAYGAIGYIYKERQQKEKSTAAYQQAVAFYQQAIRMKPDNAEAYSGLGWVYVDLGQKNQALQAHRMLLRLDKKLAQELLLGINKSK